MSEIGMSKQAQRELWDVIVIGGGPPGENAAQYAAAGSGLSAVIVEQGLLGGECSYWACMPSRAGRGVAVDLAGRHQPA